MDHPTLQKNMCAFEVRLFLLKLDFLSKKFMYMIVLKDGEKNKIDINYEI